MPVFSTIPVNMSNIFSALTTKLGEMSWLVFK
jgi:hypothetical protein